MAETFGFAFAIVIYLFILSLDVKSHLTLIKTNIQALQEENIHF